MFIKFSVIFFLLAQVLFSLTLKEGQNKYTNFTVYELYDKENILTIQDMPSKHFEPTPSQFSFGYLKETRWFKVVLTNATKNENFILSFSEPLWKEFDFFSLKNGVWNVTKAGLSIPIKKRQINDKNPAFFLKLSPNQTQTFYIRGQTDSGQLGAFELFTQKEFFNPSRFDLTDVYLFFIVFLFIIAFFNIYLFSAKKEKLYALYIAYIFSMIIWLSVKSGLYLILDIDGWNHGLHVTGTLVVALLALFSCEFLELKKRFLKMYYIFYNFALLFFILAFAIAFDINHASLVFNLTSTIFFTILMFVSIKVWREGHLEMRYYLIALFVYMPTMGLLTLTFNGFIENTDLSRYSFLFGSFFEVIFFNSLMISHYHIVFRDKIRIQNELIQEKEKVQKTLENKVTSSEQELEYTKEKFEHQYQALENIEEKLSLELTTDYVTKVYNRRYINGISTRIFDTAVNYNQSLSVMIIQLAGFKKMNTTYGYTFADEVLLKAATIIQEYLQTSQILSRYADKEFLVLLPRTSKEETQEIAQKISLHVQKETILFRNEEKISFHLDIGLSHLKETDLNIQQLIQRATKPLENAQQQK